MFCNCSQTCATSRHKHTHIYTHAHHAHSFLAGMFTVLKNLSSLTTMWGDYLWFGKKYGLGIWLCVFLMVFSAFAAGSSDPQFSVAGYTWQILNCFFTSG